MNERIRKAYIAGFVKRANAYGINPQTLIKMAGGAVTKAVAQPVTRAATTAAIKPAARAATRAATTAVTGGVMSSEQVAAERAAWAKREAERVARMKADIERRQKEFRRLPNGEYLEEYKEPSPFADMLKSEDWEKVLENLGLVGLVGGTGAALGYTAANKEQGQKPAAPSAAPRRATMLELR